MSKSTTPPCPAKISDKSKECCQRAGCRYLYNDEKEICEPKCVGNGHMIDPDTCECSCDTQKWHTLLQPDGRTCKPCPENTKLFFSPPRCVECKGQGSTNRSHSLITPAAGFQTDSSKPRYDWLTLSQTFPHWLRAPSSQNQFENPP